MATKTKNKFGTFLVVCALFVGAGYWAVTELRVGGRAVDDMSKWAAPKRMTKPTKSDRPTHTVKFIVEMNPGRKVNIHATAGVGQSWGPAPQTGARWSHTASGVRTGEFAELNVEEATDKRGGLRCWILVDGKLYRDAGRDTPYRVIWNTAENGTQCWARVVVG